MEDIDESRDVTPVFLKHEGELKISLRRDQIRTLNVIRGRSRCESNEAKIAFEKQLAKIGLNYNIVSDYIFNCDMTINMNPKIIELMLNDTHYRSSFETNTHAASGGGINNYMDARFRWESKCFLGLYDKITDFERPKYGALNYLSDKNGAAPSYGKCFIILRDHVKKRTTISAGDTSSHQNLGVLEYCCHIINKFSSRELRGVAEIINTGNTLITASQYRELQFHGEISLHNDIKSIHVPKMNSDIGRKFADKFGVELVINGQ